jgi:hypothetical protein
VRLISWAIWKWFGAYRVDEDLLDEMVAGIDAEAERQAERS